MEESTNADNGELLKELQKKDKEIETLKNKLQKAEDKLLKAGLSNKYTAYVIDNYKEEYDLLIKILTKHNTTIWNMNEFSKRLYIALNGMKEQKAIFTKKKLNTYLKMIDKFSLEEYRAIEFAPIISSDKVIYDRYEQIVRCLKGKKPSSSKNWGFEESTNENKENLVSEDDKDEILDLTDVEDIE